MLEAAGLSRREIARRAHVAPSSVTKLMSITDPHVSKPVVTALQSVR